jgi:feruloyl esterase
MRKLYAGLTASSGERIVQSLVPGAERDLKWVSDPGLMDPLRFADMFRYGAFLPDPGPTWQPGDLNHERDYKRLGMMEALYSASNPDLRRFKAAGGKLIIYHGWGDILPPLNTVDYYETMVRTMGGSAATQDFARLYMIPGMDHCVGGAGAWLIDYLSYLEAWVERGQAPELLLGAHVASTNGADWQFPLDPAKVRFTRPVYPYPLRARYKGRGDPNDAGNFIPVER